MMHATLTYSSCNPGCSWALRCSNHGFR